MTTKFRSIEHVERTRTLEFVTKTTRNPRQAQLAHSSPGMPVRASSKAQTRAVEATRNTGQGLAERRCSSVS